MTQTLTTDELRQIVDSHEKGYGMSVPINYGYLAARELLANREAQPVAYIADCGTIVSEIDPFFDEYKNPQPLYTAHPAPAYPERLPCPVHLLPGLKFGKGVPTRSMLDALKRREEYEAELDAMTPEQKSENDERLEKLKALIPLPAPSVPDGFKLMPMEMTDEIGEAIAMEARCCGGIALCIYEAALAAAPEGGNGA